MSDFYTRITRWLHQKVWLTDPQTLSSWQRSLLGVLRMGTVLAQELFRGQLALQAMSLVYTTLLSLVPLLAVSFSVLKGFGVHNQLEPMLHQFLAPLGGERADEATTRIVEFVEKMDVRVLGWMGLGMLIYTVIATLQKVEGAFNHVWNVRQARSFGRRFADFFAVTLIGPVLLFSGIGVTASFLNSEMVQQILAIEPLGRLVVLASLLAPTALIVIAFTFVYLFVPNTRVRFLSAFIGAIVAGGLWQATGLLFASFAAGSTRYSAIYSGFAILILFMIWLYLSWFILLFGAQVAYYHQHPEQIRPERERFQLSGRLRERVGLVVMYLVADAYHRGGPFWTLERLVQRLALPGDAVLGILEALRNKGHLLETGDDPPAYIPGRDPEEIRVLEIIHGLRSAEEGSHLVSEAKLKVKTVDHLLVRMHEAIHQAFGDLSLEDLVRERQAKTHLPEPEQLH